MNAQITAQDGQVITGCVKVFYWVVHFAGHGLQVWVKHPVGLTKYRLFRDFSASGTGKGGMSSATAVE